MLRRVEFLSRRPDIELERCRATLILDLDHTWEVNKDETVTEDVSLQKDAGPVSKASSHEACAVFRTNRIFLI